MSSFIKQFTIDGLFGYKNVRIDFEEPYRILVGENGSGKTTILNCLYYTLEKKIDMLLGIRFSRIRIDFSKGFALDFTKDEVVAFLDKDDKFQNTQFYRMLSEKVDNKEYLLLKSIVYSAESSQDKADKVKERLRSLGFNFSAPSSYVFRNVVRLVHEYMSIDFAHKLDVLDGIPRYTIFYFPTFRRVESSIMNWDAIFSRINSRFPFIDKDDITSLMKDNLIQFGMDDVESSIHGLTDIIKKRTMDGFGTIMGNMLSQLYKSPDDDRRNYSFEDEKIRIILDRLGANVKQDDKEAIVKYASSGKLDNNNLNYLIGKLVKLYEDQEKYDIAIKNFRDTCNHYLRDKRFVYNESTVDLFMVSAYKEERLGLECLSSGEKQIVSLFSKIYLDVEQSFVMLLDEPELSLSIFWQEQLLPDIIASNKCKFLLAVTHSPFIYSNNALKPYAAGIADFIVSE
ncbi:ATP-binding protein [Prevotella communis]|uniref:AAA family ATPase n=1 Tax=Prevotella communis TaxID=2913614 RepID=UPI001EDB9161|nr:AAA family ATPase [Prevotella communis]UKK59613.1 ATP-binding protein [Prevotella communis]